MAKAADWRRPLARGLEPLLPGARGWTGPIDLEEAAPAGHFRRELHQHTAPGVDDVQRSRDHAPSCLQNQALWIGVWSAASARRRGRQGGTGFRDPGGRGRVASANARTAGRQQGRDAVDSFPAPVEPVGINLRRLHVPMSAQGLNRADVIAIFQ
jgi:hypothetical protein